MSRIVTILRALWATEPARVVAAVVAAAALVGLRLSDADVLALLTVVLPILLGGEATRHRVAPYSGEFDSASDDLLADAPGD